MLKQITWTSYIEIVLLLLIVYYSYIVFKYYREDLRRILRIGQLETGNQETPQVLRYEGRDPRDENFIISTSDQNPDNRPDGSPEEADELIRQLKQVILSASGKPFSPAVMIPQVKQLFRKSAALRQSPHRPAINELVVSECERLGTALLTEDEVDQWWNE
ncbi:hypothetical protein SAMN05216464_113144 [Mucilaginibacter pineti]|uniref:Uncharacterized protein n=1 Tax=Mucilaginibacter pineti TaxID=1391627 RepID=A0A1G7ISC5_9SPHI|nr:hypothetical protein [Mucilaginibacter pineti]SDF15573.1 hypothetical protein SAMN05216464_113144 [Mucilaginibacter pineti]